MAEKNPLRSMVVKESFWTFVTTTISRVGALLFTILMARFLLPEGFGLYSLALSVSIIFATMADLGVNQSLLRYVSYSIERSPKKAAAYFNYLLGIKKRIALISSALLLITSYFIANYIFHKPLIFPLLVVLSFYTLTVAFQGFFDSLFYTKNKVSLLSIKEFLFQILRIGLAIVVFLVLSRKNYAVGATIALLASAFIALVFTLIYYKKIFNFPKITDTHINKKRVLTFLGFITLSSLAGVLFSYMDTLVMGLYVSLEYIGHYRAAMNLVVTIAGALSFPGVFLAVLTKINDHKLQSSFDKILKILMIIIIPAIFGVIALSRYFLVFVYGYDYLKATPILYLLAPLIFFFVMTSIFLSVIAAREKTKHFSIFTLICTALNILLNIFAIKLLLPYSEMSATLGVAGSTLLSWAIYFAGGVLIINKDLKIKFRFKFIKAPFIAATIMLAVLFTFQKLSPDMNLIKGILSIVFGAAIYFALLFFIGEIKKEDLIFIRGLIKR